MHSEMEIHTEKGLSGTIHRDTHVQS